MIESAKIAGRDINAEQLLEEIDQSQCRNGMFWAIVRQVRMEHNIELACHRPAGELEPNRGTGSNHGRTRVPEPIRRERSLSNRFASLGSTKSISSRESRRNRS